jgi:AcrR family transcriptional regulator
MARPLRTTRDKILDAAERLFARRGFYGVSIRDITAAAGVDVALVNYHFGRKQELFAAVLERRAAILNDLRLERLEECKRRAAPRRPSVEDIIDAFTHPLLERSARGGQGWKSYFALIAQINNSAEFGATMMTRHFDVLVQHFMQALREVLPDSDERDLYWSYHFLTGALTLTFAETRRIDNLSGGVCRSNDLESVHERLVPFIAAGFRELCSTDGNGAARVRKHRLAKRVPAAARPETRPLRRTAAGSRR